ncbi:cation-translocating P-type ATPase [Thioalkalivibrio sulfidiphilus]|uniref:cation-translocating P-type ATPase n=1 Tax=Thioalkalivibrio sulfidiphilus TaxID=1033854 RepID=UPI0018CBA1FE|nr:HAD-IC family P-type ATPase [Thioalkalivibrio sulfidiphilus]
MTVTQARDAFRYTGMSWLSEPSSRRQTRPIGRDSMTDPKTLLGYIDGLIHGVRGQSVLQIRSRSPGRLRVHLRALHRQPRLCRALREGLQVEAGINTVQANPRTGNVLIQFDPDRPADEILALLHKTARGILPRPAVDIPTSATRTSDWDSSPPSLTEVIHEARHDAPTPAWHAQELRTVFRRLGSRPGGLSIGEAEERRRRYGPNRLPQPRGRSELAMISGQVFTLPVALLGVSAAVSIATGGVVDAAVIAGVVVTNTAIGFFTERQAERTIASLGSFAPRNGTVIRARRAREIPVEDIVPGDVVHLRPGSHVSADLRLIKARHLSIDESALTGESVPVSKHARVLGRVDVPLAERHNMAYMGTLVTGGDARAVVVGTGLDTELGRIQSLVSEAHAPETPMQRQLDGLGTQLALLSGAVCVGVFAVGLLRGQGLIPMLKSAVSLAVAAVPEGLPAVATTTLALGINNMRRHRVAVRHLDAVESLGSVQVLCLDKTGTLTENRMTVVSAYSAGERLRVQGRHFEREGEIVGVAQSEDLRRLLETIVLCSETELKDDGHEQILDGSPTEKALVELALGAGIDVRALRERHPRVLLRHRAEGRPYMVSIHDNGGTRLLAMKGSPAEVLARCNRQQLTHGIAPLDEADRQRILRENEHMAGDAMRVLGAAYAEIPARGEPPGDGLIWVGLTGMIDPLRPGMTDLIRRYHEAGVETIMITGDQGATAAAIGRELGLSNGRPLNILEATRLEGVDPQLLAGLVKNTHVFARVSPAHKLQIVQALQAGGRVVAMTGDGINDGPALKAADVGVAMGRSGTDVARAVADVVLEDDNLHTMGVAIAQGRSIYDNIRKTVHFLLSTNFTEIEVMLAGLALGQGAPLNPMQLLWINLISDIFPGLALSLEAPEPDVLKRPPRDPAEPIIRAADLRRMGIESGVITASTLASYAYALKRYGPGPRASTQAFNTLTVAQLLHAIVCRSRHHGLFNPGARPANPRLQLALGASLAAQLAAGLVPGVRRLLGTTPMGPTDLVVAGAGAVLPLLINEAAKLRRAREPGHADGRATEPVSPSAEGTSP